MQQNKQIPKILFLKQTALKKHWFYELGVDLAELVGPVEMYSSLKESEQVGNLKVHAAPPYEKKNDLIRLWSWFKYFCGAVKHVFTSHKQTLLFIVSQPPYLPLLGYLSHLIRGQKYIIWVDDVMPDLLVRHKRFSEQHFIIKFLKWFNRLIFSRAEQVITLGPCMADLLKQYLTHPKCKVTAPIIVPTWVDSDFIKPINKSENKFAQEQNQVDKLTVLYSGNLGLSHDLDTMLKAAEKLQNRPDIHFMIIGHGPQWDKVKEAAEKLSNITLLPFQPEEVIPYSIAMADIAVVSLDKNFEGISMPSKTYYMMAGEAAILGLSRAPNDLEKVIAENNCGFNIEPGDADKFAEVVLKLAEDKELLNQLKQNSRSAAVEKYSRPTNVQKVFQEIKKILPHFSGLSSDLVLTYGWNRVAYNILRSLSQKGIRVAVGDASDSGMAKSSKFCHSQFIYPSFYQDPQKFVQSLKQTLTELQPKAYFPVHEEIFVVAKYIDQFKDLDVNIPIHDFETLKKVHKKDSFAELAKELNICIPKTAQPTDISELKRIWNELGPKVVIKTVNSNSSKGVFYAESYEALEKRFLALTKNNQFPIIQEYVVGDGWGVSMLYNKGELRAKFTHKRLREKTATGGTSTKRVSAVNPQLEEMAKKLLDSLNWHGVAMLEFKYNQEKNQGWMIEVNPRFWGSLALAIHAGVDFPYLLYKIATEGDCETVLNYKEGVVCRWILGDILATLGYMKAHKSLKPAINFFKFKNEKFDDWYSDDLKPFFSQCWYYFSKFIKTRSTNPTEEAMLDVDEI